MNLENNYKNLTDKYKLQLSFNNMPKDLSRVCLRIIDSTNNVYVLYYHYNKIANKYDINLTEYLNDTDLEFQYEKIRSYYNDSSYFNKNKYYLVSIFKDTLSIYCVKQLLRTRVEVLDRIDNYIILYDVVHTNRPMNNKIYSYLFTYDDRTISELQNDNNVLNQFYYLQIYRSISKNIYLVYLYNYGLINRPKLERK